MSSRLATALRRITTGSRSAFPGSLPENADILSPATELLPPGPNPDPMHRITPEPEASPDDGLRPSKSQLKRDSAALQQLGAELLELSPSQLDRLELPESLREALRQGQAINAHGAARRQLKFIGKLLRGLDPEPIRRGLAGLKQDHAEAVRLQRRIESWRDRLLGEGPGGIDALCAEFPDADRQRLRQLIRDALRDQCSGRPPHAARALYRELRLLLQSSTLSAEGP